MPDSPRARSVTKAIRPFRWRIAFTYALTVVEDLLELSYPWATGLAINGLLAQDYRMVAPVMTAWVLHTAIGGGRQMYDTRLYTHVYNAIVVNTVLHQRQAGIEPTKVAARSAMSREFVTFFEKDMPVVLNTLVTIVGSAAILFYYDLVIGAVAALLFIPVAIINRSSRLTPAFFLGSTARPVPSENTVTLRRMAGPRVFTPTHQATASAPARHARPGLGR
jgi:hypothetical protein